MIRAVVEQGPEGIDPRIQQLVGAITRSETVRLVYARQSDEVVSIHDIAPVDIRPGETPKTSSTLYIWAWCFAEDKPETHLLDRIHRVLATGETFELSAILARWPEDWPLPDKWAVPR